MHLNKSNTIVVIIMGPPGAGKGTQAELLVKSRNLIHFDTGRYLEELLYNPAFKNNEIIQKQREFFESGKLVTPSWLLGQISQRVKVFAKADLGIVVSGSPRTLYEAFGDRNHQGLMDVLEKLYGKKNIFIFRLKISDQESIKRNSQRLICTSCGLPLLKIGNCKLKINQNCPFCGGKLYRRVLDKPEIIKKRLLEYRIQTLPVIEALKKRKYQYFEVDGKPLPFKIHKRINDSIKIR
jgi:adenylate kinase